MEQKGRSVWDAAEDRLQIQSFTRIQTENRNQHVDQDAQSHFEGRGREFLRLQRHKRGQCAGVGYKELGIYAQLGGSTLLPSLADVTFEASSGSFVQV